MTNESEADFVQVPLSHVPEKTWVLHQGVVKQVLGNFGSTKEAMTIRMVDPKTLTCFSYYQDTPVVPLLGTKPRLLTETDVGALVYDPNHDVKSALEVTHVVPRFWRSDGSYQGPDWPVWIIQPAPEAEPEQPISEEARAEVDRLWDRLGWNESGEARWIAERNLEVGGWQLVFNGEVWGDFMTEWKASELATVLNEYVPNGLPEPERPSAEIIALDWAHKKAEVGGLQHRLAEHGYSAPVDLRDPELVAAIEWFIGLLYAEGTLSSVHARTLRRALGQEAPDA